MCSKLKLAKIIVGTFDTNFKIKFRIVTESLHFAEAGASEPYSKLAKAGEKP